MRRWPRALKENGVEFDILVNNAGILRDKTFAKMEMSDFDRVVAVHLTGSANCTKAVWNGMRERNYGRVILTSSASGIYGNFGQANYGAAKAAMIGLMNVLHLEGAKYDIRVNTLAPTAATAMTDGLLQPEEAALLSPESVTPAVLFLASEIAPSRVIVGAGRRRLRGDAHRGDDGRLSRRRGAVARNDRRPLGRDRQRRSFLPARRRSHANSEIRRISRPGAGRPPLEDVSMTPWPIDLVP